MEAKYHFKRFGRIKIRVFTGVIAGKWGWDWRESWMGRFALWGNALYVLFKLLPRNIYYYFYNFWTKTQGKIKARVERGDVKQKESEYRKRKNSFWFWGFEKDFRGNAFWAEPEKTARKKGRNGISAEGVVECMWALGSAHRIRVWSVTDDSQTVGKIVRKLHLQLRSAWLYSDKPNFSPGKCLLLGTSAAFFSGWEAVADGIHGPSQIPFLPSLS